MSVPVIEQLTPLPVGIVLALYPADAALAGEVERAPDSAGAPDTGSAVIVGQARPGDRTFFDYVGATGPWWYRWRHIRPGATAGNWTHWIGPFHPTVLAVALPNIPKLRVPTVQEDWERASSTTATLTLTIYDPDRVGEYARFNKREGSESGDAFTGWLAGANWDVSTGTFEVDATMVRAENVLVEAGQESIIRWEVAYNDDEGELRVIAGAQSSQNADEDETTVYWPAVMAAPNDDTVPVDRSSKYLANRVAGSHTYTLMTPLPPGVKVTAAAANLYRADTDGSAVVTWGEFGEAADVIVDLTWVTLTHATTNYDTVSGAVTGGGSGVTISINRVYFFRITLDNASGAAGDERCLWCRLTYTRKSQAQRL